MAIQNFQRYIDEVHTCPHCKTVMSCCEATPIHVGDGLGWGSEVLFICLNDECKLFINGWSSIEARYGHHASYRYMEMPGSTESNVMMVGNAMAFTGSIIDLEALSKQNDRYKQEKASVKALATCVAQQDLKPAMFLILNEAANIENRRQALRLLLDLNDLACIDPIRNHTFRDSSLEQESNMILSQLLKNNFLKECVACAELIKAKASKCKHCQADQ